MTRYIANKDIEPTQKIMGIAVLHATMFYCLARLALYMTYTPATKETMEDVADKAKEHITSFVKILCTDPSDDVSNVANGAPIHTSLRTDVRDVFSTPLWEPLLVVILQTNAIISSNVYEMSGGKIDIVGTADDLFADDGSGLIRNIIKYSTWGKNRTDINPYAIASAYLYIYGKFYENRVGLDLTYDNDEWA